MVVGEQWLAAVRVVVEELPDRVVLLTRIVVLKTRIIFAVFNSWYLPGRVILVPRNYQVLDGFVHNPVRDAKG